MNRKSIGKIIGVIVFVWVVSAGSVLAASASLTFSPSSGTVTVGQDFNVAIQLDTNGAQTDGARALINYDTNKLEVRAISNGVYETYPTKTWESGQITISGLAPINGPYYSGSGTLATITFRPKATGSTTLTLNYTAGSTTDSNVAEHGTSADILGSVGTATFTIQSAGAGATVPTATPTSAPAQSGTGNSGSGAGDGSTGVGAPASGSLPNAGAPLWTWLAALFGASLLSTGSLLLRRV